MVDTLVAAEPPLLEVANLSVRFQFDREKVEAVRAASFTVGRGEAMGLVGESGSGKSVTARAIMGLLPNTARRAPEARIMLSGARIDHLPEAALQALRGNRIAMIFQEPMSSLNPVYRIGSQIVETLRLHRGLSRRAAWRRAEELLHEVRIPDPAARLRQYPHQLSGGQRQRVMIAIAIANEPELLIADEPTTALDVTVQAEILSLLNGLRRSRGMGLLLITHDLSVVRRVCDRVAVMRQGQLVEQGSVQDILERPQHAYSRLLTQSEPTGSPPPLLAGAPELLKASHVRIVYRLPLGGLIRQRTKELRAVDDASLQLRSGETLGIVGESGSGKTTLGRALLRLAPISEGTVEFDGARIDRFSKREMRRLRPRMQVVFQDPFASLNPRLSVRQIIEEGLIVNDLGNATTRLARIRRALEEVNLTDAILGRFPHEFSGGQRQRIAIARALALDPTFVLLDEPTSALDRSVQAQILALLRDLQVRRGLSYVFISHDLKVIRVMCHRVLVMKDGKIVEHGDCEQVMRSPQHPYTRSLLEAAFD
jgi:peptide/nickel transport system ATP-binding protein